MDSSLDLNQRLASILDFLEASAKTSGQFAAEQTPLLIQEILRFGLWINVIVMLVAPILAYPVYRLAVFHFRIAKQNKANKEVEPFFVFGLATVIGYAPAILALVTGELMAIYNVLLITLAPRLYLIKYVADLIK